MSEFNYYGLGQIVRPYDFKNKGKNIQHYITYMLNRVQTMFRYEGLPDTIPKTVLELYLMINGHAVIVRHNDKLYVCFGSFGGEPNEYYVPTQYIVANPYLKLFNTFTIDVDCVLIRNDSLFYGLLPMFRKYATQLVENDISMNMVDINSRVAMLLTANNDKTKESLELFLKRIESGENGVIAGNLVFDALSTQPYADSKANQMLTDLIEYHQYIKASWFNAIGLQANYNMKRESINSNESQLNDDMLIPLIDDMLECRKQWCEQVNAMFGTNITVSLASAWEENEVEREVMLNEESSKTETDVSEHDT